MTEPNDPPNFAYAIPSFLGFLERAAGATDPRQFSFDLIGAFDELMLLFKPGRSTPAIAPSCPTDARSTVQPSP